MYTAIITAYVHSKMSSLFISAFVQSKYAFPFYICLPYYNANQISGLVCDPYPKMTLFRNLTATCEAPQMPILFDDAQVFA